jgi:hypothetical protein
MRKLCLAACVLASAVTVEGLAGEVASDPPASRPINRRAAQTQFASPVYAQNGNGIPIDPAAAGNAYGRRCRPHLLHTPHYEPDYGATHGWGFPGGRWDPSLPRD